MRWSERLPSRKSFWRASLLLPLRRNARGLRQVEKTALRIANKPKCLHEARHLIGPEPVLVTRDADLKNVFLVDEPALDGDVLLVVAKQRQLKRQRLRNAFELALLGPGDVGVFVGGGDLVEALLDGHVQ